MTRDRTLDHDPPSLGRGGAADPSSTAVSEDPRDACLRAFDLPRGPERALVRARGRSVRLRGSEARLLAAAGTFRLVPAEAVRHPDQDRPETARDVSHLRRLGLVHTTATVLADRRATLVTLTPRGRDLLEGARRDHDGEPRQAVYAGISKPRELTHDARLYDASCHAADRLAARDARVRRIVLEEELKREYQQLLQAPNRGRSDAVGEPDRDAEAIARWAHDRQLPCTDGHVQFPDVRLEIEEPDGRRTVEDLEVVTPHYRGAHAAAKAQAGFTRYRSVGARVGGGRSGSTVRGGRRGKGPDPHLADEWLS